MSKPGSHRVGLKFEKECEASAHLDLDMGAGFTPLGNVKTKATIKLKRHGHIANGQAKHK